MPIEYLNASQPWDMLTYVNTVTHGWAGPGLLIIIWLSTYATLGLLTPGRASAGASYLTGIIAVIFLLLGIVNVGHLMWALAGIIISAVAVGAGKD